MTTSVTMLKNCVAGGSVRVKGAVVALDDAEAIQRVATGDAAYVTAPDVPSGPSLEALEDLIPGKVRASKALVVGASRQIATLGPITGDGDVSIAKSVTGATPDTDRLVRSELTVNPAASVAVTSNGSLAGVRGCVTLSSGKAITDGFMYGVQGKLVADGATINNSPDHVAGLYGQLSLSGSTLSGGHIAAVIASIQNVPTSSLVDLFYGESATGNVINSFLKAFGKADYVFDLASNTHTQMKTSGSAGTTTGKGWLKVLVEGLVRYIPLSDSAS
jgi:hypothetical protein